MFRLMMLAALLTAIPAAASAAETVRYRCKDWKAKHVHDTAKAETITATLKKLKCEVKRSAHGGHEDVQYRCPKWHQLQLKTHARAHKWEAWLKEFGFETEHQH